MNVTNDDLFERIKDAIYALGARMSAEDLREELDEFVANALADVEVEQSDD